MGARLTEGVPVLELLKPTGYDCPAEWTGKTIGEITTPVDPSVEENHAENISANGTTVIEPTEGKDAMAKVTVTVDVNSKLFAWKHDTDIIYTLTATPALTAKALVGAATGISQEAITAVGDEYASITVDSVEYSRDNESDISL